MPKKHEFSSEDYGSRKTIIVLCVDTSNSLYTWQREINAAVRAFMAELDNEPKSRYGTEIAVVTYDTNPRLHMDFTSDKSSIKPVTIPAHNETGGWTDMGEALSYSIDIAIERWKLKKSAGVPVYLPWVILFTDGRPENKERNALEKMNQAILKLQELESPRKERDKIHFIGIGVGENVDISLMRRISAHGAIRYLHTQNFGTLSDLFKFVGATTVKAGDIRLEYDTVSSSFQHQKPKGDKPDISLGESGFAMESPIFAVSSLDMTDRRSSADTFTSTLDTSNDFQFSNEHANTQGSEPFLDDQPEETPLEDIDAYFMEVRRRGNQNAGWFT